MPHGTLRVIFSLAVGIAVSLYAWHRVTDPEPAMQRAREEAVVRESRDILRRYVNTNESIQIVDPLDPDRKVGKVYIYPAENGWEVSGHYRRSESDRWHPYLMQLDPDMNLSRLSLQDEALLGMAERDRKLFAKP